MSAIAHASKSVAAQASTAGDTTHSSTSMQRWPSAENLKPPGQTQLISPGPGEVQAEVSGQLSSYQLHGIHSVQLCPDQPSVHAHS